MCAINDRDVVSLGALAAGCVVGLALFVGPLILRRFLNPLVSSEAGLRAIVEIPVLVSIPRIPTADSRCFEECPLKSSPVSSKTSRS